MNANCDLFRNSYSCTQRTWFVWYVYIFSLIRLENAVFRYSQLSSVQVSILVGIQIIEAGLSLCFISSFLFHILREIFWRNRKPERLVPVLLRLGSKLGKCRKLTVCMYVCMLKNWACICTSAFLDSVFYHGCLSFLQKHLNCQPSNAHWPI